MGFNVSVNLVSVLVASIAGMVAGYLWYSEHLFGKQWMKLSGITKKDMKKKNKKDMQKNMFYGFLSTVVMAYVLAMLINLLGANSAGYAAKLAGLVWLGFFATSQLGSVLWEGKPFKLYVLNTAHSLTSLLIMGAILGGWA